MHIITKYSIGKILHDMINRPHYSVNEIKKEYSIDHRTIQKYIKPLTYYRLIKNSLGRSRKVFYIKPNIYENLSYDGIICNFEYYILMDYIRFYLKNKK